MAPQAHSRARIGAHTAGGGRDRAGGCAEADCIRGLAETELGPGRLANLTTLLSAPPPPSTTTKHSLADHPPWASLHAFLLWFSAPMPLKSNGEWPS